MTKNSNNKIIILALAVILAITISLIIYKKEVFKSNNRVDKEIKTLETQSDSTEIEAIEKDLNDTDLSNLDRELEDIEKELNSAF